MKEETLQLITQHYRDLKKTTINNYTQKKFHSLQEMNEFLQAYSLLRQNYKEIKISVDQLL